MREKRLIFSAIYKQIFWMIDALLCYLTVTVMVKVDFTGNHDPQDIFEVLAKGNELLTVTQQVSGD